MVFLSFSFLCITDLHITDQNVPLCLILHCQFLFDIILQFCNFISIWSYFCASSLHALKVTVLTQQTQRSPLQDTTFCNTTVCNGPVFRAAIKYLRMTDSFSLWLHGKSLTLWGQCRTVMTALLWTTEILMGSQRIICWSFLCWGKLK